MSVIPTKAVLEIPGFGEKMVEYKGGTFYQIQVGLGNPPHFIGADFSYMAMTFEAYKVENILDEPVLFMRICGAEKMR